MKILKIHDDKPVKGACTMECEFSSDEVTFFIEYAVNDILKKQIARMQNEFRPDTDKDEVQD